MTREEFIDECLEMIKEIEDDHQETNFLVGFINEQMLTADFQVPLEEIIVLIREYKPRIYMHMKITSGVEFRKLLNTDMSLEKALERLGKEKI